MRRSLYDDNDEYDGDTALGLLLYAGMQCRPTFLGAITTIMLMMLPILILSQNRNLLIDYIKCYRLIRVTL
jgi:hypothetical protein